jgi:vacuolar-type H+-ATPase subunit F/Vma7
MFEQPPLEFWAIFALKSDEILVRRFIDTLKDSLKTFNYFTKEPKVVLISSRSYGEWDEALREHLNASVQATILIIPGRKGYSNPLYEDLKKLLVAEIPIPSQMILAQTIDKAKGSLYSVTNRLLMKFCAKIGGEPWAVDELPFFNLSSMAVSYYVDTDQIALVASINQKATRYWSKAVKINDSDSGQARDFQFSLGSKT